MVVACDMAQQKMYIGLVLLFKLLCKLSLQSTAIGNQCMVQTGDANHLRGWLPQILHQRLTMWNMVKAYLKAEQLNLQWMLVIQVTRHVWSNLPHGNSQGSYFDVVLSIGIRKVCTVDYVGRRLPKLCVYIMSIQISKTDLMLFLIMSYRLQSMPEEDSTSPW